MNNIKDTSSLQEIREVNPLEGLRGLGRVAREGGGDSGIISKGSPLPPTTFSTSPSKYSGGYLSRGGINQETQIDAHRQEMQPRIASFGNMMANLIVGELVGGVIEGTGYLFETAGGTMTKATEDTFNNILVDLGKGIRERVKEAAPVYQDPNQGAFAPNSWAWWMNNLPTIASTVSIMVPGYGAVKGIQLLGKILKAEKGIATLGKVGAAINSPLGQWAGKGLIHAGVSRHAESLMEATGAYEQAYAEALEEMSEQIMDEYGVGYQEAKNIARTSRTKELEAAAADAGTKTYAWNWLAIIQDIPQYLLFHRFVKAGSLSFAAQKQLGTAGKLLPVMGKKGAAILWDMAGEGVEEMYQFFVQEESIYHALVRAGLKEPIARDQRYHDYWRDGELYTSAMFGALGAGAMMAGRNIATMKNRKAHENEVVKTIQNFVAESGKRMDLIAEAEKNGNIDLVDALIEDFVVATAEKTYMMGHLDSYIESMEIMGKEETSEELLEQYGISKEEASQLRSKHSPELIKQLTELKTEFEKLTPQYGKTLGSLIGGMNYKARRASESSKAKYEKSAELLREINPTPDPATPISTEGQAYTEAAVRESAARGLLESFTRRYQHIINMFTNKKKDYSKVHIFKIGETQADENGATKNIMKEYTAEDGLRLTRTLKVLQDKLKVAEQTLKQAVENYTDEIALEDNKHVGDIDTDKWMEARKTLASALEFESISSGYRALAEEMKTPEYRQYVEDLLKPKKQETTPTSQQEEQPSEEGITPEEASPPTLPVYDYETGELINADELDPSQVIPEEDPPISPPPGDEVSEDILLTMDEEITKILNEREKSELQEEQKVTRAVLAFRSRQFTKEGEKRTSDYTEEGRIDWNPLHNHELDIPNHLFKQGSEVVLFVDEDYVDPNDPNKNFESLKKNSDTVPIAVLPKEDYDAWKRDGNTEGLKNKIYLHTPYWVAANAAKDYAADILATLQQQRSDVLKAYKEGKPVGAIIETVSPGRLNIIPDIESNRLSPLEILSGDNSKGVGNQVDPNAEFAVVRQSGRLKFDSNVSEQTAEEATEILINMLPKKGENRSPIAGVSFMIVTDIAGRRFPIWVKTSRISESKDPKRITDTIEAIIMHYLPLVESGEATIGELKDALKDYVLPSKDSYGSNNLSANQAFDIIRHEGKEGEEGEAKKGTHVFLVIPSEKSEFERSDYKLEIIDGKLRGYFSIGTKDGPKIYATPAKKTIGKLLSELLGDKFMNINAQGWLKANQEYTAFVLENGKLIQKTFPTYLHFLDEMGIAYRNVESKEVETSDGRRVRTYFSQGNRTITNLSSYDINSQPTEDSNVVGAEEVQKETVVAESDQEAPTTETETSEEALTVEAAKEGVNPNGSIYKSETKQEEDLTVTKYTAYRKDGKKVGLGGRVMSPQEFISEYNVTHIDFIEALDGAEQVVVYEVRTNNKDGSQGINVRVKLESGWMKMDVIGQREVTATETETLEETLTAEATTETQTSTEIHKDLTPQQKVDRLKELLSGTPVNVNIKPNTPLFDDNGDLTLDFNVVGRGITSIRQLLRGESLIEQSRIVHSLTAFVLHKADNMLQAGESMNMATALDQALEVLTLLHDLQENPVIKEVIRGVINNFYQVTNPETGQPEFIGYESLIRWSIETMKYNVLSEDRLEEDDSNPEERAHVDGQNFKTDPEKSMSARIRRFLHGVPRIDDLGNPVFSPIGLQEFEDPNSTFAFLADTLANKSFKGMLQELRLLSEVVDGKPANRLAATVLEKLESKETTKQVLQEFYRVFKKQRAIKLTVLHGVSKSGVTSFQVMNSNSFRVEEIILKNWEMSFRNTAINTGLVKKETRTQKVTNKEGVEQDQQVEALVFDKEKSVDLVNRFNDLYRVPGKTSYQYAFEFLKLLREIGININPAMISKLESDNRANSTAHEKGKGGKRLFKDKYRGIKELIHGEFGYIFSALGEAGTKGYSLDAAGPFKFDNKGSVNTLRILARYQKGYEPGLYSAAYRNVAGELVYSYVNPNYMSDTASQLTESPMKARELLSTPYAANNLLLERLAEHKGSDAYNIAVRSTSLQYTDGLRLRQGHRYGLPLESLNEVEKETLRLAYFWNNMRKEGKERVGSFIGFTPADKTSFTVFTKALHLTDLGNGLFNTKMKIDPNSSSVAYISKQVEAEIETLKKAKEKFDKFGVDLETANKYLLPDYHFAIVDGKPVFGSARYLYLIPPMNNHIKYDKEGKLVLPDNINELIKQEVVKMLETLIQDKLQSWHKKGIVNLDTGAVNFHEGYNKFLNNEVKLPKPKDGKTKAPRAVYAAADYMVNSIIANIDMLHIYHQDPALKVTTQKLVNKNKGKMISWQQALDNASENGFKRISGDIAPGDTAYFPEGAGGVTDINYVVANDPTSIDSLLGQESQWLGEQVKEFLGMDTGVDGFEFINPLTYVDELFTLGEISELQRDILKKHILEDRDIDAEKMNVDLGMQKPVYAESIHDPNLELIYKLYVKSAALALFPQISRTETLSKIRKFMMDNNIDRLAFKSAVKLGARNIIDLLNPDGTFNDNVAFDPKIDIIKAPRSGFRKQQAVPYDPKKDRVTTSTQADVLLFGDLDPTWRFESPDIGTDLTAADLKNKFDSAYEVLYKRKLDRLIRVLGLSSLRDVTDGKHVSMPKLVNLLVKEAESRGYDPNVALILNHLTELKGGKYEASIPLFFNFEVESIEALLNSLIKNKILKRKSHGFSGPQSASVGMEFNKDSIKTDKDGLHNKGIVWINKVKNKLDYRVIEENGKKTVVGQVVIPFKFKDSKGNLLEASDYITENGVLDTAKLPPEVLEATGLRIPFQGPVSIVELEVVGFTPSILRDTIFVPTAMTKQMGSDFDIDKLYVYTHNYNVDENGNISKIRYNLEDTTEAAQERYDNIKVESRIQKAYKKYKKEFNTTEDEFADKNPLLTYEEFKDQEFTSMNIQDFLLFKSLPIEEQLTDEQLENMQLDIRIAILRNEGFTKAGMQAMTIDPLKKVAEDLNSLIPEKKGLDHTKASASYGFINPEHHTYVQTANADGKIGVGSFSNAFVRHADSQNAGLHISMMYTPMGAPIDNSIKFLKEDGSLYSDVSSTRVMEGDFRTPTENYVGQDIRYSSEVPSGLWRLDKIHGLSGKLISKVIEYFQGASVDIAKENLLFPLNVNKYTMQTVGLLARVGLDEVMISTFLKQPILAEFLQVLDARIGLDNYETRETSYKEAAAEVLEKFTKKFATNKKLQVTLNTFKKILESGGQPMKISELRAALSTPQQLGTDLDYTVLQIKVLASFLAYHSLAGQLNKHQSAFYVDTKYLERDIYSSIEQTKNIDKALQVKQFGNMRRMMTGSKSAAITYGLNPSVALFGNESVIPLDTPAFQAIFEEAAYFSNLQEDRTLSAERVRDILNHIRATVYASAASHFAGDVDINLVRKRLVYGTEKSPNLMRRIMNLPTYNDHVLLKALNPNIPEGSVDAEFIELAVNTINKEVQSTALSIDWLSLLKSQHPDASIAAQEREIAKDLILYAFAFGAEKTVKGFAHLIPVDALVEYFGKDLRGAIDYNNELTPFRNGVTTHFFMRNLIQHEPTMTPRLREGVDSYKFIKTVEGSPAIIEVDSETMSLKLAYRTMNTPVGTYTPAPAFHIREKKTGAVRLFLRVNSMDFANRYMEVPLYGSATHREAQILNTGQHMSVVNNEMGVVNYPDSYSIVSERLRDVKQEADADLAVTSLFQIATNSSAAEAHRAVAQFILNNFSISTELKIKNDPKLDNVGRASQFNGKWNITINTELIRQYASQVGMHDYDYQNGVKLHEVIHTQLGELIDRFKKGTLIGESRIKAAQRLQALMDILKTDKQFAQLLDKNLLSPDKTLGDLQEFVATVMSYIPVMEYLNNKEYKKGKSLGQLIIELLTELFTGQKINPDSMLAEALSSVLTMAGIIETNGSRNMPQKVSETKPTSVKTTPETSVEKDSNNEPNFYEGDIKPEPNTIFVFGSNPEGRHGAGAAKVARTQFGAIYGQGEGLQGNAYALPTKRIKNITPIKSGKMSFNYGNNKRAGIDSQSTFEAIINGERTATTRYESDGHLDYWKGLKQGDIVEFKDGDGNKVYVKITKPLTKLLNTISAEEWSKKEGWSVDYFNSKVKPKINEAWQMEYEFVDAYGKKTVTSKEITESIKSLYEVAKQNPEKQFKIAYRNTTETSLNGYTGLEMIEMFNQAGVIPSNIIFSKEWVDTGLIKSSPTSKTSVESAEQQGEPIFDNAGNFIGYSEGKAVSTAKATTSQGAAIFDKNGRFIGYEKPSTPNPTSQKSLTDDSGDVRDRGVRESESSHYTDDVVYKKFMELEAELQLIERDAKTPEELKQRAGKAVGMPLLKLMRSEFNGSWSMLIPHLQTLNLPQEEKDKINKVLNSRMGSTLPLVLDMPTMPQSQLTGQEWNTLVKQVGEPLAHKITEYYRGFPSTLMSTPKLYKAIGIPKKGYNNINSRIFKKVRDYNTKNQTAHWVEAKMINSNTGESVYILHPNYLPYNEIRRAEEARNRREMKNEEGFLLDFGMPIRELKPEGTPQTIQQTPQEKLLSFLNEYGFEITDAENLVINLAAKQISLDTSNIEQVSKALSEPLSEMLSYSDYFYEVERAVRTTKRFINRLTELESEYEDSTKRNLRRMATKEIFKDLLEKGFSEKLAKEVNISKSLLDKIKEFITNLIKLLDGVDWNVINKNIDSIVEKTFKGQDFIRLTKKQGYKLVDFQKAFDENEIAKDIMTKIGTNPNIVLTGSIAYATQGSVYRNIDTVVHDLDFVNNGLSKQEIENLVLSNYPEAVIAYSFFDQYQVDTFLIPPKGIKIQNVQRRDTGKITSYELVDNDNNVVGTYNLQYEIGNTGRTINEVELKTGLEAMLVDFFTNDVLERPTFTYDFIGSDNKTHSVNLSEFAAPFEAKLRYSRFKDIWDYNRFIPNTSRTEKPGVAEVFESNPELADSVYEALGFNNVITSNDKIVWGHPAIGKTTMLDSNPDAFIDWDNEFNRKRDSWIANKSNTVIGTPEFKKARNEYMINYNNHKDYIAFVTEEWSKAKEKANKENKTLIASPHMLLNLFPNDFDKVITMNDKTFMDRAIRRSGGDKVNSKLWKEGINETLKSVDKSKIIETDKYINDLFITPQQAQQAQQQYSQYLDTIFPDSRVKNIVTHFSKNEFEVFDKNRQITGTLGKAFYFYPYISSKKEIEYEKGHGNNVRFSILNINKLGVATDTRATTIQPLLDNNDGVKLSNTEIVVFEPEQIHILGSKQDIEGFRKFMQETYTPAPAENDNLYRPDPDIRAKYFSEGNSQKASAILSKIANSDHVLAPLAEKLSTLITNDVEVILREGETVQWGDKQAPGVYFAAFNSIEIAENSNSRLGQSELLLLHEILHAMSYWELKDKTSQVGKDFKALYDYALTQLNKEDYYGLTNVDEFITELFTNGKFVKALMQTPPADVRKYKNLFEEILDYIFKILGISKTETLYTQAMATATHVLSNKLSDTEIYRHLGHLWGFSEVSEEVTTVIPTDQVPDLDISNARLTGMAVMDILQSTAPAGVLTKIGNKLLVRQEEYSLVSPMIEELNSFEEHIDVREFISKKGAMYILSFNEDSNLSAIVQKVEALEKYTEPQDALPAQQVLKQEAISELSLDMPTATLHKPRETETQKIIVRLENEKDLLEQRLRNKSERSSELVPKIDKLQEQIDTLVEKASKERIVRVALEQVKEVKASMNAIVDEIKVNIGVMSADEILDNMQRLEEHAIFIRGWSNLPKLVSADKGQELYEEVSEIVISSQLFAKKYTDLQKELFTQFLSLEAYKDSFTEEELFGYIHDAGRMKSNFITSSLSHDPLVRAVTNIFKKSKFDANQEYQGYRRRIEQLVEANKKLTGKIGEGAWDWMIEFDKNNVRTGHFVGEFSSTFDKFLEDLRGLLKKGKVTEYWETLHENAYVMTYLEAQTGKSEHFTPEQMQQQKELMEQYEEDRKAYVQALEDMGFYNVEEGKRVDNPNLSQEENNRMWEEFVSRVNSWEYMHSPWTYLRMQAGETAYKKGMLGFRYLITPQPKAQWKDPKYTAIQNDPAKKAIYDSVMQIMEEVNAYLPKYRLDMVGQGYIPETDRTRNFWAMARNAPDWIKQIFSEEDTSLYDPTIRFEDTDRTRTYKPVPVKMLAQRLTAEEKSYDLGKILLLYSQTGMAYKFRSKIESFASIAMDLMGDKDEALLNSRGTAYRTGKGGLVAKGKKGPSNSFEVMEYLVDSYLYDDRKKRMEGSLNKRTYSKEDTAKLKALGFTPKQATREINNLARAKDRGDITHKEYMSEMAKFEGIGQVVTLGKMGDKLISFQYLKALSLPNIISPIVNFTFGTLQNFIYAAGGVDFTTKDMFKATGIMMTVISPRGTISRHNTDLVYAWLSEIGLLGELNESRYGEPKDWTSKATFLQIEGEKQIQAAAMVALLLNKKVPDASGDMKSLWQAYKTDETGRLVWNTELMGEQDSAPRHTALAESGNGVNIFRLGQHIEGVVTRIHGDYLSPMKIKQTVLGRVMMLFRTWLPMTLYERFGGEVMDERIGRAMKGRYRSYKAMSKEGDSIPILETVMKTLGRVAFIGNRFEKYSDLDRENLRKNVAELRILTLLAGVGVLLKGLAEGGDDDGDEMRALYFALANTHGKALSEFTFFLNPQSANQIVKNIIPVWSTVEDLYSIFPITMKVLEGDTHYQSGPWKGIPRHQKWLFINLPFTAGASRMWNWTKQRYDYY